MADILFKLKFKVERNLKLFSCGKVIVPQKPELDSQLDLLAKRGIENGAKVEFLDEQQLHSLVPQARSASGRALWSPNTAVVKPIVILRRLLDELQNKGVRLIKSSRDWKVCIKKKCITLSNSREIYYDHLINCAGLQADKISHYFGVGLQYKILPFKGIYWQIKNNSPFNIKTNLYPVPDLNVPFLGVHFTPSADINPIITIGPTATPSLGRENYKGLKGVEPLEYLSNLSTLFNQYIMDLGGFRKYVKEQSLLSYKPFFIKAAQELIPTLEPRHIELSKKVGIRAQLFNKNTSKLEDDFLCLDGPNSTHVLNAISPAFTASFAFADLVVDKLIKTNKSFQNE